MKARNKKDKNKKKKGEEVDPFEREKQIHEGEFYDVERKKSKMLQNQEK